MSEELIEELALALVNRDQERFDLPRIESVEDFRLESDAAEYIANARAILPIIRRLQLEAGEKVRDAAATVKPTNTPASECETTGQWTRRTLREAIRALDVAAIIGDTRD